MKKLIHSVVIFVLLSFTLSSCGVMFGGSKFKGSIIAKDHPNAQIYINGNKEGQGTVTGFYPRNKPLNVELRQDGCEPKTQTFKNRFRTGNFILSVFMWGIAGVAVDLGTGAAFKPDHKKDPSIKKVNEKYYVFTVDYSGCSSN